MDVAKATPDLGAQIQEVGEDEVIEVVVELTPLVSPAPSAKQSRTEKIAAQKQAFSDAAKPLRELITSQGGEITGEAWITNSLRARVSARTLRALGRAKPVAAIDVPHRLSRE